MQCIFPCVRGRTDVCGCFPTGRHYPGIADLIADAIQNVEGLCHEFEPGSSWEDIPFTVIDFETTGRDAETDRVIEIGLVTFEKGKVVKATATKNEAFLLEMLAVDDGAKFVGEFAFGTNPYVDRFCKDILIDEKIGGTVHIALGRAYPECGGINQSAIHWDIVKDLRREGAVYLDGKAVLKDGKLTL